jgi:hypothetical protein
MFLALTLLLVALLLLFCLPRSAPAPRWTGPSGRVLWCAAVRTPEDARSLQPSLLALHDDQPARPPSLRIVFPRARPRADRLELRPLAPLRPAVVLDERVDDLLALRFVVHAAASAGFSHVGLAADTTPPSLVPARAQLMVSKGRPVRPFLPGKRPLPVAIRCDIALDVLQLYEDMQDVPSAAERIFALTLTIPSLCL